MRLRVNHPEGRGACAVILGAVQRGCPDQNPLDLIQTNRIIGARQLVIRDLLGVLTAQLSPSTPSPQLS